VKFFIHSRYEREHLKEIKMLELGSRDGKFNLKKIENKILIFLKIKHLAIKRKLYIIFLHFINKPSIKKTEKIPPLESFPHLKHNSMCEINSTH
jgi:hypothetical protein